MFRLGGTLLVSLRGATNGGDAAIHRVSKDAYRELAVRLPVLSGSPRADAPAMTIRNLGTGQARARELLIARPSA